MVKKPIVSIIILNYNGLENLKKIISSIKNINNYRDCEMIIADNNSIDRSKDYIEQIAKDIGKGCKGIRFVQNNKNIGTSNYDIAIPYCNGEYVLFLGNDMALEKDSIIKLIGVLEENQKAAQAVPKLLSLNDKKNIDMAGTWLSRSFYGNGFKTEELGREIKIIPYMGTGLIRKSVLKEIHYLFDPDYFFYSEDVDLGLRIRMRGYETVYVPDSIMYHKGSVTSNKKTMPMFTYLMERNSIITFFKICSIPRLILYFPYVFGVRLLVLVKNLLTLHFKTALFRSWAMIWWIFHLRLVLRKRKEVQGIRKMPDSYVFAECDENYFLKSLYKRL
ncbi:MAG: glycosyltransferase family 2 protein [Candidatus Woesearchaeota archaeon]